MSVVDQLIRIWSFLLLLWAGAIGLDGVVSLIWDRPFLISDRLLLTSVVIIFVAGGGLLLLKRLS